MSSRSVRYCLAAAACAATASITAVSHAEYRPPTELMGDGGPVIPLKNAAMIQKTDGGYRYIAGQQNSNITVTAADGKLRLVDTGTRELRDIPSSCSRRSVPQGISAVCTIPSKFDGAAKMFVEVWPRLGNDVVDGSALSSEFRFWVLADAGFDTVYGGAGNDFVNAAQDADRVWGGAGSDWLRGGKGNDRMWGGTGADKLVGDDGSDALRGGDHDDRVGGGAGSDLVHAGTGRDVAACGSQVDTAYVDRADKVSSCERLYRS